MKKILLIGYYGYGNLGDELMRESIKEFLNKENFKILELLPKKLANSGSSFSRFNLFSVFKALMTSNIVIYGGGGIFQDKTSFKSFLYYYLVFKFALFFGKPVIFFGNSFGPFNWILSRYLFKDILKSKNLYIFARDEVSYNYAKRYNPRTYLVTDPAIRKLTKIKPIDTKDKKAVIIPRKFKNYIPVLLSLSNEGFSEVVFVPFSPEDIQLAKKLSNFSVRGIKVSYCNQIEMAIDHIQQSKIVISERFHGSLISAYFGIPFISIKDEKFRRFFQKYFRNYQGYANDVVEASYKIPDIKGVKLGKVKESMDKDMEEMYEKFKSLVHNIS